MLAKGFDDVLHFGMLLSMLVRWAVSRFSYSGAGKPPMYGDYEAQRHWMEITVNLPVRQWYQNSTENDLLYWGLDYPPLTAYHSMICGFIAKMINPNWVSLYDSRGFEGYHHKIFMRTTVFIADLLIFYVPVLLYWNTVNRPYKLRDKAIAASLCVLYPGLILIDHGHFQYNSVCLGLTLWAIVLMMWGFDVCGAVAFTLALHYKQMALYYALPFFCYLLGTCFQLPWKQRIVKFFMLAVAVIVTSAICWLPFLSSLEDILHVVSRLFPFGRGLYEDKVANIWCSLSIIIKFKKIFSTSTLAGISAMSTLVAALPSSLNLLFKPSMHKLRFALVNCSLIFFLLSFQVHEKTILFPALPVLLLLEDNTLACGWFVCISTFSLIPLLAKDGLIVPFFALTTLFLIGWLRAYKDVLFYSKTKRETAASYLCCASILGSILLVVCMFTVKQPAKYPHLHVLLNCIYSAVHFVGFAIYFNVQQFTQVHRSLYTQKLKLS